MRSPVRSLAIAIVIGFLFFLAGCASQNAGSWKSTQTDNLNKALEALMDQDFSAVRDLVRENEDLSQNKVLISAVKKYLNKLAEDYAQGKMTRAELDAIMTTMDEMLDELDDEALSTPMEQILEIDPDVGTGHLRDTQPQEDIPEIQDRENAPLHGLHSYNVGFVLCDTDEGHTTALMAGLNDFWYSPPDADLNSYEMTLLVCDNNAESMYTAVNKLIARQVDIVLCEFRSATFSHILTDLARLHKVPLILFSAVPGPPPDDSSGIRDNPYAWYVGFSPDKPAVSPDDLDFLIHSMMDIAHSILTDGSVEDHTLLE